MKNRERIVYILKNNEFIKDEFKNIKKGDKFKLFEQTGEQIVNNGNDIYKSKNDAYIKNNVYTVDCDVINK